MKLKNNNIKLKFNVEIWNDDYKIKKIKTTEVFNKEMTIYDAFQIMYEKYSIRQHYKSGWVVINFLKVLWSQYFPNELYESILIKPDEYFNISLKDYEKQFKISSKRFDIVIDSDGMGRIAGIHNGITYMFHTNEKDIHHNPHLHCKYRDIEYSIDINTLEIICKKKLKSSIIKETQKFIKMNKKSLLNYWNKAVVNGEAVECKMKFSYDEDIDDVEFDDEYLMESAFGINEL